MSDAEEVVSVAEGVEEVDSGKTRVTSVRRMQKEIKGVLPNVEDLRKDPGRLVRLVEGFQVRLENGSADAELEANAKKQRTSNMTKAIWRVLQSGYECFQDMPEAEEIAAKGNINALVGYLLCVALGWRAGAINVWLKESGQKPTETALESVKRIMSGWRALEYVKTAREVAPHIPFEISSLQNLVEIWATKLTPKYGKVCRMDNLQRLGRGKELQWPKDEGKWKKLARHYDHMAEHMEAWAEPNRGGEVQRPVCTNIPVNLVCEPESHFTTPGRQIPAPSSNRRRPRPQGRDGGQAKEKTLRCWSCGQWSYTPAGGCVACSRPPARRYATAHQGQGN